MNDQTHTPIIGKIGGYDEEGRICDFVEEPGDEPYIEIKNIKIGRIPYKSLVLQVSKIMMSKK